MAKSQPKDRPNNFGRPLRFVGPASFIVHRRSAYRVEQTAFTAFISPEPKWRFAVVASKRLVGGAVERNRAKRRLREAFKSAVASLEAPFVGAVALYTKASSLTAEFDSIVMAIKHSLDRAANHYQSH